MQISAKGTAFIGGHEGTATKAYRCPAGVVTIGVGFTMGSKVFAEFWRGKYGRGLQMGDTIARADSDRVLALLLNTEYGAAVTAKVKTTVQHRWDGATSMAYNCGPGALGWQWAKALAAGNITEAARLLRTTAVTANGKRLNGLVRRRSEEARLIEVGDYGAYAKAGSAASAVPPSISTTPADVKVYQQQLVTLGYALKVTGDYRAADSAAAVMKFQRDNGLLEDGKVGPATRATLIRAIEAKAQTKATVAGGAGGSAGGATDVATSPAAPDLSTIDPSALLPVLYWGVGIAVVVAIGFVIWRYRGVITGRRVPT